MPPKTKPDTLPADAPTDAPTDAPADAPTDAPADAPTDAAHTSAAPPHLAPGVPADQDSRALASPPQPELAAALPPLRLRALHPVRHDGTRYGPGLPAGDEFSADDATAAELRGLGVVELLGEESPE